MNKVFSVFIYIVSSICAAHAEDEKVVLGSLYCGTEYAPGITYGMTIRKAAGSDNMYDIIWTLPWNDKSYVNTGKFKLKELTKDSVIFIRDDFGEYKASIDSNGNFLNGTWRNFKNPERNGPTPGFWELIKVKTSPDCVVIKKTDVSPVGRRKVIPIPQMQKDSVKEVEPKDIEEKYQGHTYRFISKKESWNKARAIAKEMGCYLASITSEEENKFIVSLIQKACFERADKNPEVWIGLNNDNEENIWKWESGDRYEYAAWWEGEPNNFSGSESSVVINKQAMISPESVGRWNDKTSDFKTYFVIEKSTQ
jgi:hypothetical protein